MHFPTDPFAPDAPPPVAGSRRQRPVINPPGADRHYTARPGSKDHVSLNKAVSLEIVRTLFVNAVPPLIMVAVFAAGFTVIRNRTPDGWLLLSGYLCLLCGLIRLITLFRYRSEILSPSFNVHDLRRVEVVYATSYLAFALFLGLFGGRVMMLPDMPAHTLVLTMLLGYCAGVASTIGLRPVIAIPAVVLAVAPAAIVATTLHDPIYLSIAIIVSAFAIGGCHSMALRAKAASTDMRRRITFGQLARQDVLTGLPNRLALREHFNTSVAAPKGRWLAVHYIDLNGFKDINDMHGHAAGDCLLTDVAERLRGAVQAHDPGSLVARIGGDEFAVVQCNVDRREQVDDMAHVLSGCLGDPFSLGTIKVAISAGVGSALCTYDDCDLDDLLAEADSALYRVKG